MLALRPGIGKQNEGAADRCAGQRAQHVARIPHVQPNVRELFLVDGRENLHHAVLERLAADERDGSIVQ